MRPLNILSPTEAQDLLDAARKGSRDALGDLLQAYRPLLLMLAGDQLDPALRPKVGASDLVQQTYLDAWSGFEDFHGHTAGEFRHWLTQIIRYNACDACRRFRTTGKRQAGRELSLECACTNGIRPGLKSGSDTPLAEALRREQREALQHALARLPEGDRLVIELRHREGLSFDDIAHRLGCTLAAARQRWLRAVELWHHTVEEEYGPL
jgi:RNA polymerase sigma-70 factor (ECF subfamily)